MSPSKEERTAEILERVKEVFAVKGFEGATMQDLAHAAGMSAGNFYRYFPSKDAIIAAMCDFDLRDMAEKFEMVRRSATPLETFRHIFEGELDNHTCHDAALWSEMEATSFRKPELAVVHQRIMGAVADNLTEFLMRITQGTEQDRPELAARAEVIMMLFKGLARHEQTERPGSVADDGTVRALVRGQIDHLLSMPLARTLHETGEN